MAGLSEAIVLTTNRYAAPSGRQARCIRARTANFLELTFPADRLLRAVEVYELDRIDFAEAYLVACAESSGVSRVASFDKSIDRVGTVERVQPSREQPLSEVGDNGGIVRDSKGESPRHLRSSPR